MSGGEPAQQDFIYCQSCGQQLLATANFCDNCGAQISPPQPVQQPVQGPGEQSSADDGGWGTTGKILAAIGAIVVLLFLSIIVYSFMLGLASAQHTNAGEDAWTGERTTTMTSARVDGTATLDSGEYVARTHNPDIAANLRVDVDVTSGGAVDVFVMDRQELDTYAERDDLFYYSSLTETNIRSETLEGSLCREIT